MNWHELIVSARTPARVLAGAILVVACCFKMGGSIPLWFSAVFPFSANIWVLAVLVELLLGIMLITGIGWGRRTVALCLAMFAGFTVIALALTLQGESSCGCLGRVPLRPWGAAIIDLSAIALLLTASRSMKDAPSEARVRSGQSVFRFRTIMAVGLLSALPAAILHVKYRDTLVVANPISAEFGETGSWVHFQIKIHNRGSEPGMIYGVSGPKHVRIVTVLPLVIEPGEDCVADGLLFCGGSAGAFSTRMTLLADVANQRQLVVQINSGVL